MGNKTDIKQKIRNEISNEFETAISFDIDKKCIQGTDASNIIENVRIKGGKNITIDQVNQAQSMCMLKTVLDNEMLGTIQSEAKGALLDVLKSESGLGVNVTDKTQDVMNQVQNKVGVDVEFNIAEKCLQDTIAQNRVSGVVMEDVQNVNISQVNSAFNNCIMDNAIKQGVKIETKSKTEADVKGKTTVKGMNPIADVMKGLTDITGNLVAPFVYSGVAVALCCILLVAGLILPMLMGGGGDPQQIADRTGALAEGAMEIAEQVGGGLRKLVSKHW